MYQVVVSGCAERTLHEALGDFDVRWTAEAGSHSMSVVDQSQLVAVVSRLNEVGVVIEGVRRLSS